MTELSPEFLRAIGFGTAVVLLIVIAFAASVLSSNLRIRKEQRFSASVLRSSAALFIVFDSKSIARAISNSCEKLTEYSRQEILGKTASELPFLSTEFSKRFSSFEENRLTNGPVSRFNDILVARNNTTHIIEWQISYQKDSRENMELTIVSGLEITELQKTQEELLAHQMKLRALAENLSMAEAEERRKIAEELHDRIGATLTVTSIKLSSLRNHQLPQAVQKSVEDLNSTITGLLQDIRALTIQLSPPALYDIGPAAAIESLATNVGKEHSINIDFHNANPEILPDKTIAVFLYKAARELFLNIVKHARATHVSIRLSGTSDVYRMELQDNGVGFDPEDIPIAGENYSGFGLFRIMDRLKFYGGTIEIQSKPGRGSLFILEIPWKIKI